MIEIKPNELTRGILNVNGKDVYILQNKAQTVSHLTMEEKDALDQYLEALERERFKKINSFFEI